MGWNRPLYQLYCVWLVVSFSLSCEGFVSGGINSTCFVHNASNQSQLDSVLNNMTLQRRSEGPRCSQLSLTANDYQLNLTEFVRGVDLMENDSLVVRGEGGTVNISCKSVAGLVGEGSVVEYLNSVKLAKATMVVFDGLVFTGCVVYVEEVDTMVIQNCVFQHSLFGAVSIYNTPNVIIQNCTFHNNTSDGSHVTKRFQTSSGGLSISYNIGATSGINICVTGCNFTDNSAVSPGIDLLSTNVFFAQSGFIGRGGGLAIIVNTSSTVNCVVNNSLFVNNEASIWGGGLYCVIAEAYNHQSYVFENLMFVNNRARVGGALTFATLFGQSDDILISAKIHDCQFVDNIARIAGVANIYFIYELINNSITFTSCRFANNSATDYAGAIDLVSYSFFVGRSHYTPTTFINCTFDSNYGSTASSVNVGYYNVRFVDVTFRRNKGSAVQVNGGTVLFDGEVIFDANNSTSTGSNNIEVIGGALYLLSLSQLHLTSGTQIIFVNNTGSLGAAVVSEIGPGSVFPPEIENLFGASICFIRYSDPLTPLCSLNPNNTFVRFMGNKANYGRNIFADLTSCPQCHGSATQDVLECPFFVYDDGIGDGAVTSFDSSLGTVSAYPGQRLPLSDVLTDQLSSVRLAEFEQMRDPFTETTNETDIVFSVSSSSSDYFTSFSITPTSFSITPTSLNKTYPIAVIIPRVILSPIQISTFNLHVSRCPPGFTLQPVPDLLNASNLTVCKCDKNRDDNIVECVPDEERLILKEGLWATNINTGSLNGMMEYYQCPAGYCQCNREDDGGNICNSVYYYDDDDQQCVCDRQGYLCGECRGDRGVSALLNKCVSCGHGSIALIFGLVVVDIIVITVILLSLTMLTIFSWLYPLLFYLQITPYIAQYFPVTFSAVQPYLQYISSAASLYFPYDFCLYPGMTALVSYSLRYIPLVLFSIIYCCIWILSRKCSKISISWNGLWLLILLLFTDVVNTSVSILNCPILRDSDGHKEMRWFVDGTVKCFTGGHAGLATFAILVLIVCTLLIIALVAVVLGKVKAIRGCYRLRLWSVSFGKLLKEPYCHCYYWWAPVELMKRIMFLILISMFHRNLNPVMLLVMIGMAVYMYVKPYRGVSTNILEVVLLGDILVMVMITSTGHFKTTAVFDGDHSFSIDQCGKVDQISEHAAVLIPFYFLPLIILFGIVIKEVVAKLNKLYYTRQRLPSSNIRSRRSTILVNRPEGSSFVLGFNVAKEITFALLSSHQQDT